MLKYLLVLIAVVACVNALSIKPVKPKAGVECEGCLELMDEGLEILLNEIANGGIIGGCETVCHAIPNSVLDLACNLLCDFVGIKEFVKIINHTDPDPIWYCQELHACPKVSGGAAQITSMTITPTSGPIGTTFSVVTLFNVVNATGPGYNTISLSGPEGNVGNDATTSLGIAVGSYQWPESIPTNTNYTTGEYTVQVQICEGDCLNVHPYSGVYAQATANFTITE